MMIAYNSNNSNNNKSKTTIITMQSQLYGVESKTFTINCIIHQQITWQVLWDLILFSWHCINAFLLVESTSPCYSSCIFAEKWSLEYQSCSVDQEVKDTAPGTCESWETHQKVQLLSGVCICDFNVHQACETPCVCSTFGSLRINLLTRTTFRWLYRSLTIDLENWF